MASVKEKLTIPENIRVRTAYYAYSDGEKSGASCPWHIMCLKAGDNRVNFDASLFEN